MKSRVYPKWFAPLNNRKKKFKEEKEMNRIFSINFWVQTFVSTFVTMLMIYFIKKIAGAVNIPVVSEVASAV